MRYGLPDENKTAIIDEFINGGRLMKTIGDQRGGSFPEQWLLDHGWLPYVDPVLGNHEQRGPDFVIGPDSYSHSVIPWTEEMIAQEAEQIATAAKVEELKDFHAVYADFMYWDGKTDAQIDTIINGLVNSSDPDQLALALRQISKTLAKSQRDNVALFKLMRGAGILPK